MRILLAEDEVPLSTALVKILKRNNYTVDPVFNGQDAIDFINSGLYDLAILDIMMPKKDGLEVLKEVRQSGNKIPIIMLTAKSQTQDLVLGLDQGADDYITKPFNLEELLARVRAVLRRREGGGTSELSFGNLILDLKSFEIRVGNLTAKLNNKEFGLMEMLMSSPKSVISAEKFMDKLWDYDSDAEQNVVWVYISGIRKKLAQIGANVTIKTSRNIGYYLEENG